MRVCVNLVRESNDTIYGSKMLRVSVLSVGVLKSERERFFFFLSF